MMLLFADERKGIMRGLIWLWKHRPRLDMHGRALRRSELPAPKEGESNPYLTADGQLKPGIARPRMSGKVYPTGPIPRRKNRPQSLPGSKGRIEKATFPITDEPNPFEERLDLKKEKQWPVPPPSERPSALAWLKEKPDLLKTHAGWFVAYQDGKRVALEPDCDRLLKAVGEMLGRSRRPVQFHELIDEPVIHRGPSPRYMAITASEWALSEQISRDVNANHEWVRMQESLERLKDKLKPQWAIDAGRD